jgi:phage-related holin
MKFIIKLLASFNYHSVAELNQSLMPTSKYKLTLASTFLSVLFPVIDRVFGLDAYAFAALILVFFAELTSGLIAAHIKGETISSMKLSRFSFKVFYYLVLIALPYVMAQSFKNHDRSAAAVMFDWLHLFLLAQIILENVVSILENLAVISGKEKNHWISKIQDKINALIS